GTGSVGAAGSGGGSTGAAADGLAKVTLPLGAAAAGGAGASAATTRSQVRAGPDHAERRRVSMVFLLVDLDRVRGQRLGPPVRDDVIVRPQDPTHTRDADAGLDADDHVGL